jgi:hypothetical protein
MAEGIHIRDLLVEVGRSEHDLEAVTEGASVLSLRTMSRRQIMGLIWQIPAWSRSISGMVSSALGLANVLEPETAERPRFVPVLTSTIHESRFRALRHRACYIGERCKILRVGLLRRGDAHENRPLGGLHQ